MRTLYIASLGPRAGKTAMGAAIGKQLLQDGVRVDYITHGAENEGTLTFLKEALGLRELPVSLSHPERARVLGKTKASPSRTAQAWDVTVVEGLGLSNPENVETSRSIVERLDAKVLLVSRYFWGMEGGEVARTAGAFGERLLGVVVNAVSVIGQERVKSSLVPNLEREAIKVLGVLPEDRLLLTVSVQELAEHLRGTFIAPPEKKNGLIESVLVGALSLDWGPPYYMRKEAGKVVITRGDRPDVQWAALETNTRCLVLTGNIKPNPYVVNKARERGVSILLVERDTISIMSDLEGLFKEAKFNHPLKLERMQKLLGQHFDYPALYEGLGLTPRKP